MKRIHVQCALISLLFAGVSFAETIRVALEPMPPLIESGFKKAATPGYSVELLKKIEEKLGDTFTFAEAPYNRLKIGLKEDTYDLVGHMPYKAEVKEFYEYAVDIDWNIEVVSDIYVMKQSDLSTINTLKIGTPRGNKEFAAEVTGVPLKQFYDNGSIESLLQMLYAGRLDAFWFPRATTMPFLKKSGKKVYYKLFPDHTVPACFSVQNNDKGKALKARVEKALSEIDTDELFEEVLELNRMKPEGVLNNK